MQIRNALLKDIPSINEIYNQAVAAKTTGDLLPLSIQQTTEWFYQHHPLSYPVLVAEVNNMVVGWLSFSAYRNGRQAFKHTAEISYYIHNDYQRQGIGTTFIEHALQAANAYHFTNLFAIVLDNNEASIKMLKKFHFTQWAYMPAIANFDGHFCGHVYYGICLLEK